MSGRAPGRPLWRGSLLPLGCAAAPNHSARWVRLIGSDLVGAASQPSGSKLPRHGVCGGWLIGEHH
ncbi:hypothetical protein FHK92_19590 [Pseudomonas brassicacearum subsp. neoaurantiaca]|uniref:Uncharacterized protein n=1 Tax=Pseudomonas brassicacearum subsp. neoaurantiaca TaxID=494916 RepID=A0A7V8UEC9_9PSED|nr:hypothetical protein [Pseudomonas brassicacearum subsp. neoaurantiaca]